MESNKKSEVNQIENKGEDKNLTRATFGDMDEELRAKALAAAYARYLRENNLTPEDLKAESSASEEPAEVAPETESVESGETAAEEPAEEKPEDEKPQPAPKKQKAKKTRKKKQRTEPSPLVNGVCTVLAAPVFLFDRIQDGVFDAFSRAYRDAYRVTQSLAGGYRQARKQISYSILVTCIMCAVVLVVFDQFTVYEYSYNGKVLGYVNAQEDVTNVLDVAAEKLNELNDASGTGREDISFTAGENITFKLVEAENKDVDDENTAVNKLAFMTDIEVEAFGIYDDDKLVTIVKSENVAQGLLSEVMGILGEPDEGMEVVSVDYRNKMDIRPVKVLLTSVQSQEAARQQMTEGGETKFYHLAEEGETLKSMAGDFDVEPADIYDEKNDKPAKGIETGDKVCIRKEISPVSVELVEKGKMKEIIDFETVEKKTPDLYIGDEEVANEGVKGVQIFEGTLTKVGGEIVKRDTENIEVITKKVDKVILVGTTERPKTAPTGTFINPMEEGTYVVTSRPGARWGSTHEGVDMGAATGTPVYASDGGTIIRAEYYYGYGLCIDIQHEPGWITRYGHLSYVDVKAGDQVYQGQYIADVGNTGRSYGSHLHFEIRHNDVFTDPFDFIPGGL